MATNTRNALSPQSQQWAGQVEGSIAALHKDVLRLRFQLDELSRGVTSLASTAGRFRIRVQVLDLYLNALTGEEDPNNPFSIDTPVDHEYDFMVISAQFGILETFASSGGTISEAFVEWYSGSHAYTPRDTSEFTISSGDTQATPTAQVLGVYRTSEFPTEGSVLRVQAGTSTESVVTGYGWSQARISGSVLYIKQEEN